MNKSLYSFPLKPLVVALAAAQCFTSLAHADPAQTTQTVDGSYTTSMPLTISTDVLNITSEGIIDTTGDAVLNNRATTLIDNQGKLTSQLFSALRNQLTIDTLNNSGTISVGNMSFPAPGQSAIVNESGATINTLLNSGTIMTGSGFDPIMSQTLVGITNSGTIDSLINEAQGTISGSRAAIVNSGTLNELNNAGTITTSNNFFLGNTSDAIVNNGVIGSINNSGTIAGNIRNNSANELVINGGKGDRGTLTGTNNLFLMTMPSVTPVGLIYSTGADVRLQKGMLLLNDNVDLGGVHTLTNNADVMITQPLTVTGNYHQTANAILNIGVADSATALGTTIDVGYGRLNVSGNASIDSGSTIRLSRTGSSYGFASGQRYLVITAAHADYNEQTLNYVADNFNGSVKGQLINDGSTTGLALYLKDKQPNDGGNNSGGNNNGGNTPTVTAKPLPTTGNAISSLNGLSGYNGFSTGLLNLFNASKTITTEAEANRIGEQLAPTQNSMASAATSAASMDALGVIGGHLDGLRITPGASARGIATGDDSMEWAAWGKPFYGSARQGMVDNVSGYRAHYAGMILGADRQLLDNWRAGAALSYSRTSVKGADNLKGSNSDVDAWGGILYATYSGDPWFVNLSTSLTRQTYDSQRSVEFTGFSDSASSHFHGQQVAVKGEAGYPIALGLNTTLTPLASLSYSYLHQGSYEENSESGSALSVDSAHSQSVESSLGGKLAHSWSTPAGDLSPFVQLMWTHQYDRSPMTTNSGFSADSLGETRFTSQGARQASDSAETSVGVALAHADDLTLEARYDLQTAPHFDGQTVSLQVRKLF
ncbi:autotransporter family protein [Erwinia sorbitola]|uniref:Autotransporter domain-containing protein n=1 Tax=Erwinia sorbitola TaxID=2681984 RepID=A0A6I6ET11_9GAMM|nr:autotransporter outer membrane beta-barrel domain-containing protein [Erwinia sorbitola]MTD26632.1 autotransporter domain-containing protein [Erwinia sorbitola]QGU88209.1 autotransporter domain-containing protein [Erwinia sorbitola]